MTEGSVVVEAPAPLSGVICPVAASQTAPTAPVPVPEQVPVWGEIVSPMTTLVLLMSGIQASELGGAGGQYLERLAPREVVKTASPVLESNLSKTSTPLSLTPITGLARVGPGPDRSQ